MASPIRGKQVEAGFQIQRVVTFIPAKIDVTAGGGVLVIPVDGTPPQVGEGTAIGVLQISPKKIGNLIVIRANVSWSGRNRAGMYTLALFRSGGSSDALAQSRANRGSGDSMQEDIGLMGQYVATSLIPGDHLFQVRFGCEATGGGPHVNARSDGSNTLELGNTYIEVVEYSS